MGQQNKKRLKELKQKYDKMVAGELDVYDGRGKGVDVYVCHKCGKKLYTRYKDKGVTPFCIRHKCGGIMEHEYTISEEEAKAAGANMTRISITPRTIRYHPAFGRTMVHEGFATRIFWSPQTIADLKRLFPRTKNREIADRLMVSPRTVTRKARELGLQKDPMWIKTFSRRNCSVMQVINRATPNSGMFQKGKRSNPDGEFKPGARVWTDDRKEFLASLYPCHTNQEIATTMGMSLSAINNAGRTFSLRKDPEWLHARRQQRAAAIAEHRRRRKKK